MVIGANLRDTGVAARAAWAVQAAHTTTQVIAVITGHASPAIAASQHPACAHAAELLLTASPHTTVTASKNAAARRSGFMVRSRRVMGRTVPRSAIRGQSRCRDNFVQLTA